MIDRVDSRGLDFNNLGAITPEEIAAFRQSYKTEDGSAHSGFDFLIDHNPGALKSYRYFATSVQPPFGQPRYQAAVFGGIGYFAILDFDEGIRYCVVPAMRSGYSKAQIEEGLAISFMVGGTRGLATIARALRDYEWPEDTADRIVWPESWTHDPSVLTSGLDFTTMDVLPGETQKVFEWYERMIGWVPAWVRFYERFNPAAIKGWRYRYETALTSLPNQVLPLSLMFGAVRLEQAEAIRENVAMSRAMGADLDDVIQAIGVTSVFGTNKVSAAYQAAGDLLNAWDDDVKAGKAH